MPYNFNVYNGNLLFEERRVIKRGLENILLFFQSRFNGLDVYIIKN